MNRFKLLTLTFALLIFASGCQSNLTAETQGNIVYVYYDRDDDPDTEVYYKYTVNGATYEKRSEKDGNLLNVFRTGAPAVVCYNPANPHRSDVFAAGHKCGN